ncbi:MAG: hypothetical protein K8S23_04810 [Candidatus Cloacimonetes bacterium]|nr:hypothetical protein [Candidatus Cloacimonadota bacterium]
MSKKNKYFFGIFEDGTNLKVAQLKVSNGKLSLVRLEKTRMKKSIYADKGKKKETGEKTIAERLSSGDNVKLKQFKNLGAIKLGERRLDSIVDPHENLLNKFPFNLGVTSLNCNDERIVTTHISSLVKSLTLRKLVKYKAIGKNEKHDKSITYGVLPYPDKTSDILVHRGENKLFSYLEKFNQSQYKKKLQYGIIDLNDISILNIVHLNYDLTSEQNTLILYLGNEYKKVLLLKGNEFIKSVSITAPTTSQNANEIARSKLMLMQDEAELPLINSIILCGEYAKESDVRYFQEKYPNSDVEQLSCENLLVDESSEITSNQVAEFAIPIALAWKTSAQSNKLIIPTNFLDKKIIESQKVFKVGWHGFIIVTLIFIFSMFSTNKILEFKNNISNILNKKLLLNRTLQENENFIKKNEKIYHEIESLKNNENQIKSIMQDKNKWSYILDVFSRDLDNNPISWLRKLAWKDSLIVTTGFTTKLENVITFSKSFPESVIKNVDSELIASTNVWAYEIQFPYSEVIVFSEVTDSLKNQSQKIKRLPKTVYREIITLYKQKDFASALRLLKYFRDEFPQHSLVSNTNYLSGEIYFRLDDFTKSEKFLLKASQHNNPLKPFSYLMLAKTYDKIGNQTRKEEFIKILQKEFPNHELISVAKKLRNKREVSHE